MICSTVGTHVVILQSDSKSKREGWKTELPSTGLGTTVLEKMREEKINDAVWQGKCSGTVYVSNYGKIFNSDKISFEIMLFVDLCFYVLSCIFFLFPMNFLIWDKL